MIWIQTVSIAQFKFNARYANLVFRPVSLNVEVTTRAKLLVTMTMFLDEPLGYNEMREVSLEQWREHMRLPLLAFI